MPAGLEIGDCVVHPDRDEVVRGGVVAKLEPRAMRVLVHLAARAGEVVSLGELLDTVWKDVVVTQDSVYTTITALRRALGDSTESPRYIATVPRRGYRLVAPVRPLAPAAPSAPAVTADPAVPASPVRAPGRRGWLAVGLATALVAAAALAWGWRRLHAPAPAVPAAAVAVPAGAPAGAERNSVAVLPFLDLSPGHDQGYFADGMAEELIDHLARIPGLLVTARTSSFYFRDKPVDLPSMAAKLNVRNLVEGSVRRDGNRVRITVQLIRAADGYHLWSQTYERPLADVFAVQDEVASALARSLDVTFKSSDLAEEGGTTSSEAYDHFLRAVDARNRDAMADAVAEAKAAVAADPAYAKAWVAVSVHCLLLRQEQITALARAGSCDPEEASQRALAIAPRLTSALVNAAYLAMERLDFDTARREVDDAVRSGNDPANAANAQGNLAFRLGDFLTAIDAARVSLGRDPLRVGSTFLLAASYGGLCDFASESNTYSELLARFPSNNAARAEYAYALAQAGRGPEALRESLRLSTPVDRAVDLAAAYWVLGDRGHSDAQLASLERDRAEEAALDIAGLHALRGDVEGAVAWLERQYEIKPAALDIIKGNFECYPGMKQNPRYQALLRRLHLPP